MEGQTNKPAYIRKKESAEAKRDKADERADRHEIVAALVKMVEQNEAANSKADSENAFQQGIETKALALEQDRFKIERRNFWIGIVGTGGLWAAALVGLLAIYKSGEDARDQRTVMQDQLTALKTQERAYVYVTPKLDILKEGQKIETHAIVQMMGQTPAFDVKADVFAALDGIPFASDGVMAKYPGLVRHGERHLLLPGPDNMPVLFLSSLRPTAEQIAKIEMAPEGPALRVYVWGRVTYKDFAGCRHFVNFCYGFGTRDHDAQQCDGNRNKTDELGTCTLNE